MLSKETCFAREKNFLWSFSNVEGKNSHANVYENFLEKRVEGNFLSSFSNDEEKVLI